MTKLDKVAVPKLEGALDDNRDLRVRSALDVAQQTRVEQMMEEPFQPTKSEIAYTGNSDARNRDQAAPMVGACTRPTVQDPPFLIELGRWIRIAVIGL